MRIATVIIQFPPDVNSTGLLYEQILEQMVERGHQVSVITTFPHYENFQTRSEDRGKFVEPASHKGMDVTRLFVWTPGKKHNMWNRLASYLSFNLLAMFHLAFSRKEYDAILCTNGSFFTGFAAWLGRPNTPFIYNVQDLYPETFVERGLLQNKLAVRALEWMELFMYKCAAHVAVITDSFKQNIVQKQIPENRVSVVPNFVDTDFIRPGSKVNGFSTEHGLSDRFVVSHAGNVGTVYDLDSVLGAAQGLKDREDILFLIIGDGAAKKELESKATKEELTNIKFLPFQPRELLPVLRAATDVHLALYKPNAARYSLPSKIYEIMASGRPVVCSTEHDSDLAQLVLNTECGLLIPPEDPEALTEAVLTLYNDKELREAMGTKGRSAAEERFGLPPVVDMYEEVLRSVVERGPPN